MTEDEISFIIEGKESDVIKAKEMIMKLLELTHQCQMCQIMFYSEKEYEFCPNKCEGLVKRDG